MDYIKFETSICFQIILNMDKLSHFELSFQKKLDQMVDRDWQDGFEDDTILEIKDALTKNDGEGSWWGSSGQNSRNGFQPGNMSGTIRKGELRFFENNKEERGFNKLFWLEPDHDNRDVVSIRALNRTFLRIIFYISENWHNTLKLLDEKIKEVVALVFQKTDENLVKINLLEETFNKQQSKLEKLETKLEQQEKLIRQIINSKNNTIIKGYEYKDLIDDDSWYNLDE